MPLAVTVNDVSVGASVLLESVKVTRRLNARDTASFTSTVARQVGEPVGIYQPNTTRAFGGTIERVQAVPAYQKSNALVFYECTCTGWEHRLDERLIRQGVYGRIWIWQSGATIYSRAHGLANGQRLRVGSTNTLPAGLAEGTTYAVANATTDTFELSNGGSITLSDAGSGVHRFLWLARDIVRSLVSVHALGDGIFADTYVSDGQFMEKRVYDYASVSEAIDELAVACGYVWYIDPELELHFAPRTAAPAPWDINTSTILTHKIKDWSFESTREDFRNKQDVRISFNAWAPESETFTGDGTTLSFWVPKPMAQIVSVTLAGEAASFGVLGVDQERQFYWSPGERILLAGEAPADGAEIVVQYRELSADVIERENTASYSERAAIELGSGIHERMVEDKDNPDGQGAIAKGDAYLAAYGAISGVAQYSTFEDGLEIGMQQFIDLFGVADTFLIDQIDISSTVDKNKLLYRINAITGTRINDYIDLFRGMLGKGNGGGAILASGGSSALSGGGSAALFLAVTLTAPSTEIASPATPSDGRVLFVSIDQDVTGGRQITWAADYASPTVNISTVASTRSIFQFIGQNGKWNAVQMTTELQIV